MEINNFNIRVYGILKHPNGSYLITHEVRGGMPMTKFVGGGLEFGEGTKECLKREFKEEMNLEIEVGALLYMNDFLQVSAFNPKDQLMSIYYWVMTKDWKRVDECIDNPKPEQKFEFIDMNTINIKHMTFPIDRKIIEVLRE